MRQYKRITPKVIADFTATELVEGNGSAAVRKLEDTRLAPHQRAWRIVKKREKGNAVEFIDTAMQQIGIDAIQRVGSMVNSADENVATRNSHFVLEQIRGKAVQRNVNTNLNVSLEGILD